MVLKKKKMKKGNKGLKNNNLTNKSIAELKALYHNDNNKNKSNQVLIRDSNFNENDENFKDNSKIFY